MSEKKELLTAVDNPATADEWRRQADYLRQELRAANKAAKNAARLEAAAAAEAERNRQIAVALEIVEYMKTRMLKNGMSAYEWMSNEISSFRNDGNYTTDEVQRSDAVDSGEEASPEPQVH